MRQEKSPASNNKNNGEQNGNNKAPCALAASKSLFEIEGRPALYAYNLRKRPKTPRLKKYRKYVKYEYRGIKRTNVKLRMRERARRSNYRPSALVQVVVLSYKGFI